MNRNTASCACPFSQRQGNPYFVLKAADDGAGFSSPISMCSLSFDKTNGTVALESTDTGQSPPATKRARLDDDGLLLRTSMFHSMPDTEGGSITIVSGQSFWKPKLDMQEGGASQFREFFGPARHVSHFGDSCTRAISRSQPPYCIHTTLGTLCCLPHFGSGLRWRICIQKIVQSFKCYRHRSLRAQEQSSLVCHLPDNPFQGGMCCCYFWNPPSERVFCSFEPRRVDVFSICIGPSNIISAQAHNHFRILPCVGSQHQLLDGRK